MTTEKINENRRGKEDEKRKTQMAVHSCASIAVAASITPPAAKLRKSAPIPKPAAVQFRTIIVRSVAGRYRERRTGKQQYPVAAGNPVPASKAGSHRHRQGERAGVLFQRGEGQHWHMGSGKPVIQHRHYAV